MKRIPAALLLVLMLTDWCRAGDRDLLAATDGGRIWVGLIRTPKTGPVDSRIFVRPEGVGQQWTAVGSFPERVRFLGSHQTQSLIVLIDGSWMTTWDGGSATGAPLPAGGRMLALTDGDDGSLWAIGSVPGGIAAARAATTEPSTQPVTQPATEPATQPAGSVMVLFGQLDGQWVPRAQLPDVAGGKFSEDRVSVWTGKGRVVVAVVDSQNAMRVFEWNAKAGWKPGPAITPFSATPPAFGLLAGAKPSLWLATRPTDIRVLPDLDDPQKTIELKWDSPAESLCDPAVIFGGGVYRVLTVEPAGDRSRVHERVFGADGAHLPGDGDLDLPLTGPELSAPVWIEAYFLGVLTFSTVVVGYRQMTRLRQPDLTAAPNPAPLHRRLAAGVLDMTPLLLALAIAGFRGRAGATAGNWWVVAAGAVIYLAEVTLVEVLTGRSLGKKLLRLKVVTLTGSPATTAQRLARNLLRVVDPLMLVIVAPLKQRTADFVADTMVVSDTDAGPTEPAP
jgi:uncharacterized RDD family membrane protein YckC